MLPEYYEFYNPVKIISGLKALDAIPFELQQLAAQRPMLITDPGVSKAGLLNPVLRGFAGSGLSLGVVFDKVPPDSSLNTVQQAAELYREHACDALLAVGGGSVIDTAKGLNICITHNSVDLKPFAGANRLSRPLQPLLVVPTTAGTGSEVTSVALVSNEDQQMKMTFSSPFLLPRVAVLDPRMLQTLPPLATAATGMDALTHAIEAFTCLQKNPLSDAYAWAALELISGNLLPSVRKGRDTRSRLAMANAATMAGIAFSNSMVGLVHSLGHAAGSVCRIPHGVAMAIFLHSVLQYNLPRIKHELGRLLLPLGGVRAMAGLEPEDRARGVLDWVRDLQEELHALCRLPRTLEEAGATRDQLGAIARKAVNDGSLIFNPEDVSFDDALDLAKQAFTTGQS
jgi:alcohol dehydrogenase